ncbi:shikimate kinase [Actinophytocola xanthii]|uniref:shikimate kinase n=1 Tax=Actinophytocola xanthii TaxID=1912961 RepID=UPI000AE19549|nr:shikimate kinase [Actinophytocola xanthii]
MSAQGPVLILVGPPGSGKSTVGRLAAEHLGVPFRDFDHDLEHAHGLPAGELVVRLGRERFQEAERELLTALLPEFTGVLALGGGTPTAPGVPELLAPFHVVFLDVDLEHLLRREGLVSLHPWLMPNPRAHLRELLKARRPVYTEVAAATVPTSGRAPAEVLADVLATLPAATG